MKALTILQPYASLIARGEKRVENRTWETKYRGKLAIHAGLGDKYISKEELLKYPTGVVVAVANLASCVHLDSIMEMGSNGGSADCLVPGSNYSWKVLRNHKHTEGPWCWVLESITPVRSDVKIVGKQGLWNIDESIFMPTELNVGTIRPIEIVDICPGCDGIYYEGPSECDCGFSGEYDKAELRRI